MSKQRTQDSETSLPFLSMSDYITDEPVKQQTTKVVPTENENTDRGVAQERLDSLITEIGGLESNNTANVIYGGETFDNYDDHPRKDVQITSGPNRGNTSSAAGEYQFLGSTWDRVAQELNLPNFSPENQRKAAVHLAKEDYEKRTGNNLLIALNSNDPEEQEDILRVLSQTWTSLPGGVEQRDNTSLLNNVFGPGKTDGATDLPVLNLDDFTTDEPVDLSRLLEDASTARKIQYGASSESMILGNVWDVVKAGFRHVTSDETYTEALADITQKDIERVWNKFPEFRGVGVYDEDLAMMGGRIGVAFVDPVTWLLPWSKAYTLGKMGTVVAGAGFGVADAALYGHVKQGEVSGLTVAISAAIGGTTLLASRQLEQRFSRNATEAASKQGQAAAEAVEEVLEEAASKQGQAVAEVVEEVLEEVATTRTKPPTVEAGPTVVDTPALPKGDTRPIREIIADVHRGVLNPTILPANASPKEFAAAATEFLATGKPYIVEKEVMEYIEETAETIVTSSGNKYLPDPAVALKLTKELRAIMALNKEIKSKVKEITKLPKGKKGKEARVIAKKELKILEEKMAAASAANFKAATARAIEGNELAFDIFDVAVKEDKLTSSMLRVLMRESVRPIVGAGGGLAMGTTFADEDDDWGYYLSTAVAGAALGRWQSKMQKAKISTMDKKMGEMIIQEGRAGLLSLNNLKFHTSATAATRLDSLGGVGKILSNLMFDRPGGSSSSLETIVAEKTRGFFQELGTTLGYTAKTGNFQNERALMIREIAGEALDGFVSLAPSKLITQVQRENGVVSLQVGHRGIGNKFKEGLTQEEVNFIKEIVPKLAKQRDALAESVEQVGISFKRIEDYGMPQIYNFDRIREDTELFKRILAGGYEGKEGADGLAHNLFLRITTRNKGRKGTFKEESLVDEEYKIRPLLDHFEKKRHVTDFNVRKELAKHGFLELDVGKTFSIYGEKTIKIREFAELFGPNGEFISESFKIVDRAFEKLGRNSDDLRGKYKGYMRGSVNAFFGQYGTSAPDRALPKVVQSLVAISNMMYLPLTGITVSLADFIAPFKTTSFSAVTKGIKGRFGGTPLHKRAGLQYDNAWELEFSALRAHTDDLTDSFTSTLNSWQKKFFDLTQLKRVTEASGKYAFDVGAYRAFEIAKKVTKNSKAPTASLKREINELGLTADFGAKNNLEYLSKFRNAKEAFEDDTARRILSRAGQKAMDRDRLVPKIGNRLLFTQSRDPLIRSLGQFTSWTQAKTAQTNALVRRIEDGDAKLAIRMLGATIIGNGALVMWKDFLKFNNTDEDFDAIETLGAAADMSGDFLPWWMSRAGSAIRYSNPRDHWMVQLSSAVSPSVGYTADAGEGVIGAYKNLVKDGDIEGAAADVTGVLPIASTINDYLNKLFDIGLKDEPKRQGTVYTPSFGFSKGGVVAVPQAPAEPDERIDKMTGMPYNVQAGMAFIDDEDPLKRLGFTGGGQVDPLVRLGFSSGGSVSSSMMEWIAKKFYNMDGAALRRHEEEAAKLIDIAIDRGLVHERERVVTTDGKKRYGDAFNSVNHILLAAKNPKDSGALQAKELAQRAEDFLRGIPADASRIDWENNKVGFAIGKQSEGDPSKINEAIFDKLAERKNYFKVLKAGPDPYAIPEKRIFGQLPVFNSEELSLKKESDPRLAPRFSLGQHMSNLYDEPVRKGSVLGGLQRSRSSTGIVLEGLKKVAQS